MGAYMDISETDEEALERFRRKHPGQPEDLYQQMLMARHVCLRCHWEETIGPTAYTDEEE